MFLGVPTGAWIFASVVMCVLIFLGLAKLGRAEIAKQTAIAAKKLEKITPSYLTVNSIWMTWKRTGIDFYLPLIKPFQIPYSDLKDGDFTQTRWLLIGSEEVEVFDSEYYAKEKYKHALHVGIAEVEVNRNGVVIVKTVPVGDDSIANIMMHVTLQRVPNGKYTNVMEMYNAAR